MEISILLAEQILAMFLTMAVGFGVVRAGLFKTEDSRIISNMVVYICNPCVVVHSFQIELTDDKIKGLMIAIGLSVVVHMVLIIGSEILSFIFHFNSIEKASIIYTNAGYLVIPLVGAVLGEEWVFYTTAFILVQTVLMWTHGVKLIGQEKELNIRKILCNPNVIAMIIGIALFALEIRLPTVVDSCVSGFGDMISPASMMVIGMVIGDVDLKWVFRQKRPYLPAQADRIPADCGCCLRRIGTEWNSSGCGIYSDDCSDCNVSSGGSNDHTACTDLWKGFQICECD